MRLWTLQPLEIWKILQQSGSFYCNPEKCSMPEFQEQYGWLVEQMCNKIGPAPREIELLVWAWYKQNWENRKPDLRSERWTCGPEDQDYVCMELSIDEKRVVLSDFDSWGIILNNCLISRSEEEDKQLENEYEQLSDSEKKLYKYENWRKVFDITPYSSEWAVRGKWVQATFWKLKLEDVKKVKFLHTGVRKKSSN